ncbi:MAG: hypothetical protein HQK49_11730 [Oligoflexia bacterium]|nr:hypothetical protein [Oligoflexia bacterium]
MTLVMTLVMSTTLLSGETETDTDTAKIKELKTNILLFLNKKKENYKSTSIKLITINKSFAHDFLQELNNNPTLLNELTKQKILSLESLTEILLNISVVAIYDDLLEQKYRQFYKINKSNLINIFNQINSQNNSLILLLHNKKDVFNSLLKSENDLYWLANQLLLSTKSKDSNSATVNSQTNSEPCNKTTTTIPNPTNTSPFSFFSLYLPSPSQIYGNIFKNTTNNQNYSNEDYNNLLQQISPLLDNNAFKIKLMLLFLKNKHLSSHAFHDFKNFLNNLKKSPLYLRYKFATDQIITYANDMKNGNKMNLLSSDDDLQYRIDIDDDTDLYLKFKNSEDAIEIE